MDWASQPWSAQFPNMPPRYAAGPNSTKLLGDLLTCTIDWNGTRVGYVYMPSMKTNPSVDTERLKEFFSSVRDLPALIIDIRSNSGGNDRYWMTNTIGLLGNNSKPTARMAYATREKLAEAQGAAPKTDTSWFAGLAGANRDNVPPEIWTDDFRQLETVSTFNVPGLVGYQGSVYVLTSRFVYSSDESFAATCRATGFATPVGTYTGGDGIGILPGEKPGCTPAARILRSES